MFGKEEAQQKRKLFWTSFGKYMKKYLPEYGRVKWLNYPTGCKGVYFKCFANNKLASFSIEIKDVNPNIQELYFMQLEEYRKIMDDLFPSELIWVEKAYSTQGKLICKIYTSIEGKSIYMEDNWKELFSFFESNLVAVHEFWEMVGDQFKHLQDEM